MHVDTLIEGRAKEGIDKVRDRLQYTKSYTL